MLAWMVGSLGDKSSWHVSGAVREGRLASTYSTC